MRKKWAAVGVPDKGSVNCLDPGLHYCDVGTDVCERGRLPS
jgi:hypothetical protein